MADYVAIPSQVKLHWRGSYISNQCFLTKCSRIKIQSHFRCCFSQNRAVIGRISLNECKLSAPCVINHKVNPCLKNSYTRCCCLGTLTNADGVAPSDWVPVINQALLMTSILLTYMAGVIPEKKSLLSSQKDMSNGYTLDGDPTFPGSAKLSDEVVNLKPVWDLVEVKLVDALNAAEHETTARQTLFENEQDRTKQPLSFYAIAEVPRLHLLCASFQGLKEEVDNISRSPVIVSLNDWLVVFSETILKSCETGCMSWLEKELCLKSSKPDKELVSLVAEKIKGDDTVLQNIRKSGKVNLYAELIHFLIYGTLRKDCYFDCSLFIQHGVTILEDLLIALADGIASIYLELISVDGTMLNEMSSLGLTFCTLSTRQLQRLRNEVAVNMWLHQNMEAIVSMYEDRFDLRTLQNQLIEEPSKTQGENFRWWKKLTQRKSGYASSPLRYLVIGYAALTVRRTRELRALTGWRYYYSLYLELADIATPLIRTAFEKVRDAISFFLVCLIGRSLGLIYTGIRQNLRWR